MIENWNEKEIIDVLIIGAGPTGLTAEVECIRLNMKTRILERKTERQSTQSRALVVHSRTMEQLPWSISKKIFDECLPMQTLNYKIGRKGNLNEINTKGFWIDDAEWPCFAGLPQYDTERIIEEEVKSLGGFVEWGKTVKSLSQEGGFVLTTVEDAIDESKETIKSKWVIGCDGGRSVTRKEAGIGFHKDVGELFILADFQVEKPLPIKGLTLSLHPDGVLGLFPFSVKENTYRVFFQPPPHFKEDITPLDPTLIHDIISERTQMESSPLQSNNVSWLTAFRLTYALSESHRQQNIFLAGDAVHLHSPIGGQGMNYGIQDAINLVWKLAWAKRFLLSTATSNNKDGEDFRNATADNIIFNSYEAERRPLATKLVSNTRRGMYFASIRNPILRFMRDAIFRILVYFKVVYKSITNSISMLDLAYTHPSPILFTTTSTRSKKHYLCKSGARMPNLLTTNSKLLYHCIDRTRHSFVMIHCSSTKDDDDNNIYLPDKGPGGLSLLHVVIVNIKNMKQPHAMLVRPDLYVAAVGDTVLDIWDFIGKKIGLDVRDCM